MPGLHRRNLDGHASLELAQEDGRTGSGSLDFTQREARWTGKVSGLFFALEFVLSGGVFREQALICLAPVLLRGPTTQNLLSAFRWGRSRSKTRSKAKAKAKAERVPLWEPAC
ncbi:hypothetical protein EMIT0P171_80027 [Pseudomonas sp. IT-P171]